jgi:hypothetical protein
MDELRRAVSILSDAAKQPLTLDGAYGGWRVEDANSQDFLGTSYVPKKQLFNTIHAVLQFHRNTSK